MHHLAQGHVHQSNTHTCPIGHVLVSSNEEKLAKKGKDKQKSKPTKTTVTKQSWAEMAGQGEAVKELAYVFLFAHHLNYEDINMPNSR